MNTQSIDAIARAVLYEGYMLYPYRPSSVKNRQRFNFGVLYPQAYSEAQTGSDAWSMQTECLLEAPSLASVEVRVRFLKLVARSVAKQAASLQASDAPPAFENASRLEVDGKLFVPWQEAVECEVRVPACSLDSLSRKQVEWKFAFPAGQEHELLHDADGRVVGMVARKQEAVQGSVEIQAARAAEGVYKVQARVKNLTAFAVENDARELGREPALVRSLVSAHILLGVDNGQFVSLLEPGENLTELAASCENRGAWPVLVGAEGERDTMLALPIILYDYPQIAPESPGDLFDGTEIDEILALRILTMTDAEKSETRNTDERARRMLERTEALPIEQLRKLHGTLREFGPGKERMP
jgi:hypothetical protein